MIDWRSEVRDFVYYGTRVSLLGGDINIVVGELLLLLARSDDKVMPPSHGESAVLFSLLGYFCLAIGGAFLAVGGITSIAQALPLPNADDRG